MMQEGEQKTDDEVLSGHEDDAGEANLSESDDELEPLKIEIDRLTTEVSSLKDELLRAKADTDNVRKRGQRDVEAAHRYGLEKLIQSVLPVKDTIDMGLEAASEATDIGAIREGMGLTGKIFEEFLEKLSVVAVNPIGEKFYPEFHQAMTTEISVQDDEGMVIRVMQKGYLLNDRLIRPALVVVSKKEE